MKKIFPPKLQPGDEVRVITPSYSLARTTPDMRARITERLDAFGLTVSFGAHVYEDDVCNSSSITLRLTDFHEEFADRHVKGILAGTGGFNSNELLRYIDWELI
jgi:muramoyltetrapeptide carboxypeptidase LdcA involved in peptidoglycan recycling